MIIINDIIIHLIFEILNNTYNFKQHICFKINLLGLFDKIQYFQIVLI